MPINYGDAFDKFLKSDIRCIKCNQSAINFSIIYNEVKEEYHSKWGNYCSGGCAMTHVPDDTKIEGVLRALTPEQLAFLATEEPVDGKGFMWTAEEEAAVLQAYDSAASFGVTIRMLKSAAQTKIKNIMDNVLSHLK